MVPSPDLPTRKRLPMNAHYTLYGMPASLYTGKARSYLRTQGIPFVEMRRVATDT